MKRNYKSPRYTGQKSKRKILGFGYYIHSNGKFTKKERQEIINKGNHNLGSVYHKLPMSTEIKIKMGIPVELDPFLDDYELLELWNTTFQSYGYLMPDFKDVWEKAKLKGPDNKFKLHEQFEYYEKIKDLEERISKLELEFKLISLKKNFKNLGF